MSILDAINNATVPESTGDRTPDNPPAPGTHIAIVAEAKFGTYDKNNATETYAVIEWRTENGQHKWSDFRGLTAGGTIQPTRVDAFKGLLVSLGLTAAWSTEDQLKTALRSIVGRRYSVDVRQSNKVDASTGQFYVNTYVNGPASEPRSDITPPAAPSMVQTPTGPATFPSAVGTPGTLSAGVAQAQPAVAGAQAQPMAPVPAPIQQHLAAQQQQPAPGARFGDDIPWDDPAQGVQPTPVQQG